MNLSLVIFLFLVVTLPHPNFSFIVSNTYNQFHATIYSGRSTRLSKTRIIPSKLSRNIRYSSSLADDLEVGETVTAATLRKRSLIESFVKKMDGKRTIQRILIANNGMAATKSILSMRQWAYMVLGDERAIEFVAMATRDDLNANAEFIRLADTFVEVPSGSNKVMFFPRNRLNT